MASAVPVPSCVLSSYLPTSLIPLPFYLVYPSDLFVSFFFLLILLLSRTPVVVTPVTLSLDTLNCAPIFSWAHCAFSCIVAQDCLSIVADAILTQQFYLIDVETALDYSLASHLPVEVRLLI